MQAFFCPSALPDAPVDTRVVQVTPKSAEVRWSAPPPRTGAVINSKPDYLVQFRKTGGEEWSERGEEVIESDFLYTLTGLQPYTYYEVRVVPFIQYGRGTPSASVKFRTAETG